MGVLKCEEPGLELAQRFYNIFFKILEPQPWVLPPKENSQFGTRPRSSLQNYEPSNTENNQSGMLSV